MGGNYAERINITAQARCECDRFMGLCSTTSIPTRYFIGLAANLVEGAEPQVLYFFAQCVVICKCQIRESQPERTSLKTDLVHEIIFSSNVDR